MPEDISAFPPPAPQRRKPWIIVVLIVVLLCCFCIGLIGLLSAFGGPILKGLGLISKDLFRVTLKA